MKSFVRSYLRNFYFLFDNYDQISFPVFYESPVGEAVKIDVVRVSSRDAKSLIDEEKEGEERRKLAGGYLFSFGAFLDRRWRLNDIMWGRLDGAERLISTLLSDENFATERAALIRQANELIIQEMLGTAAKESFQSTLVDALINSAVGATERGAIDRSLAKLEQPARESGLADVMTAALDETELCNFVTSSYEVDRKLEPQSSLEILARSTRIIGDIAGSIADSSAIGGSRLRWIARVGELLARVVSVATPNGFFNLLFTRWLQILYVFELLMIGVATFLGESNTQKLGVTLLIITIGIHLFVTFLQDLLIGDDILKRMLNALLLGFFAILALSGLAFIAALFFVPEFWGLLAAVQAYVARLEIGHLQRLLIAVPPAIVILTVTIWRRAARFDLTFTGRVLIAAAILITATASYLFSCDVGSLFFPANDGDFLSRFNDLAARVSTIKSFFWVDTLIFVPLYLSTLLLVSVLFKLRRWRFVTSVRFLVVLSVFLAAGADIAENFTGLISVNEPVAIRPGTALSMFVMTALKFGAVFVAFGLTALVFVRRDWKNVWNLGAATLMIAAGSGLVGVTAAIFGFGQAWREDLIGLAQLVAIVVLAAAGIGFQAGSLQTAFGRKPRR